MGNVDLLSLSKGTLVSDTHKAAWGWRGWVRAWGFCRLFVRNRRFFALRCQQFTGDRATTIFQKIGKNLLHKFRMLMACNQRLGMQGFNKALFHVVVFLRQDYLKNGVDICCTNTLKSNSFAQKEYKTAKLVTEMNKAAALHFGETGFTVSPVSPKMSQLL